MILDACQTVKTLITGIRSGSTRLFMLVCLSLRVNMVYGALNLTFCMLGKNFSKQHFE